METASVHDLVRNTPAQRDRYVDFLRAASLGVVVLGHWLMAVVAWGPDGLEGTNLLAEVPAVRWLTWLLQVMPVFFLVGGFSNAASWSAASRDGQTYGRWLQSRVNRLLRPAAVFTAIWMGIVLVAGALGMDDVAGSTRLIAMPLWFLAVYVGVVSAAPIMVSLHRRLGVTVALALAALVALVDVSSIGLGLPVGMANFALVWLFAHQLGILWREGLLPTTRRAQLALAGLGLAGLIGLTMLAGYPISMVGGDGSARSNMSPPSLVLVALTVWQTGLVLLAASRVRHWLAAERVWTAVVAANGVAMTVFLWHLTALAIVTMTILRLGLFPSPAVGTLEWWLLRPVWIALLAVPLAGLVAAFLRFERPDGRFARTGNAVVVSCGARAALIGFTLTATLGFNVPSTLLVVAGYAMARGLRDQQAGERVDERTPDRGHFRAMPTATQSVIIIE